MGHSIQIKPDVSVNCGGNLGTIRSENVEYIGLQTNLVPVLNYACSVHRDTYVGVDIHFEALLSKTRSSRCNELTVCCSCCCR